MDCRKGPTGIGFDQENGLFNASDEWWAKMEKVDSVCYKFRMKPLDHEELMHHVFTGLQQRVKMLRRLARCETN
ncbi:unnamed protein product [Camellia sinensis]